jgi:hypothetical protein
VNPALTIAFFTGQSDPDRCALSPEQQAFLARLAGPGRTLHPSNFPFHASPPYREVPIWRAAWRNWRGYAASREPRSGEKYRAEVAALIQRAPHTLFLVGSSGLELFNNLTLPNELERRCVLIGYGAVARRWPRRARTMLVRSPGDWLARWYGPRVPAVEALRGGHMNYLSDPAFLTICQEEIANLLLHPCDSISA